MIFNVDPKVNLLKKLAPDWCFLISDNWDDFSNKTSFVLHYVDKKGIPTEIGSVKIMSLGLHGQVLLPASPFEKLGPGYCSLGQGQGYYEALMTLPEETRDSILMALSDCVFDSSIYRKFEREDALINSLMRTIKEGDVKKRFKTILEGNAVLSPYHFEFKLKDYDDAKISVRVKPESTPQTNVHVLIGRNGTGKTRILSGISDELTGNKAENSISLDGSIILHGDFLIAEDTRFTSLITIVFSAFDQFNPMKPGVKNTKVRYSYVGLKKYVTSKSQSEGVLHLKTMQNLTDEFRESVKICLDAPRRSRWVEAIKFMNADPIFSEYDLIALVELDSPIERLVRVFSYLSSGHKIALLSITKLVELVEEQTLVLIDEPETHLHPPLLSSFTRAISDLLAKRNAVALIATHSPVVLHETFLIQQSQSRAQAHC